MADLNEPDSENPDPQDEDEDFIASITPDVMKVLNALGFFGALDDLFRPENEKSEPAKCRNNFEISKGILRKLGFEEMDVEEAVQVLHEQGACCDCEILYNVAEESRLKARYWKGRYKELYGDREMK